MTAPTPGERHREDEVPYELPYKPNDPEYIAWESCDGGHGMEDLCLACRGRATRIRGAIAAALAEARPPESGDGQWERMKAAEREADRLHAELKRVRAVARQEIEAASRSAGDPREALDVLRALIYASDQCVGHRDCGHSLEPWQRARTLLDRVDGAPASEPAGRGTTMGPRPGGVGALDQIRRALDAKWVQASDLDAPTRAVVRNVVNELREAVTALREGPQG